MTGSLNPVAVPRPGVGGGGVPAVVDAGREVEEDRTWHLVAAVDGRGIQAPLRMHPLLPPCQVMGD